MVRKITMSVIMVFFSFHYSFAFQDGDFQYWNVESITWKAAENLKMELEEEFRFGNELKDFYYQHTDIGATYSGLADWLDIGINYRLIFQEKNNKWNYENIPHLNTTLKLDVCDFNFSTRNRFEYRDKENAGPIWRYRNKFTMKLPKFTQLEIQPYITDEIFVDFEEGKLNCNRLSGGISLELWKNLSGEIFYVWQSSESGDDWIDYNVLGTKLKLSF